MKLKIDFEKILYTIVLAIMIGIPCIKLLSYILLLTNVIDDSYMVNQAYVLWIGIPLLLIIYLYKIITKKIKIDYIDIIIYLLIILTIISTVFSVDITKSILGEVNRSEGLLSLLSYHLIFLNVKNINNELYKKNIIKTFIILGVIQVLYGFLQVYTNFNFIKHYSKHYMAMGLCGNPNFFGSYMVLLSLITITMYLLKDKLTYLILSILFLIGLFLANSTAPFIGFLLALIFSIIYNFKYIKIKNILIILVSLIVVFISVDATNKIVQTKVFNNKIDNNYVISNEIVNTINKNNQNNLGNGRIELWKNSLPLVKNYWLIGSGPDTFKNIYPNNGLIFDKAHNIYLQNAITMGIPSLILYLLICLIIFIKGFKLNNILSKSLYIAFIGYSIQAFANISVIDVAPYFFIILGLLYNFSKNN